MSRLIVALVLLILAGAPPAAADLFSYAFVRPDASLKIRGKIVRLYGIHIPPTGRTCRTFLRPAICAPRAALALDFKIQGFVRCKEVTRGRDRAIVAVCTAGGEDLAAYLLSEGWALALPGAPFAYEALERIARTRHRGIWGFQVDSITRRGAPPALLDSSRSARRR